MSSAKDDFLNRINSLHKSIHSESVTNRIPTPENSEHNAIAKILRNGLAVVSFAALEDFIKQRSSEVMSVIGTTTVPFSSLPEKLQNASTYEAVKALSFQLQQREKTDKTPYIQHHASKIASTTTSSFALSEHTFGYDQSNVTSETIKKTLACMNVNNPWLQMTRIASRLSLTGLPLEETFRSASKRRHRAAHVAAADTPQSDIQQFVLEAFAIAIAFDLLISKALSKLSSGEANYLNGTAKVNAEDLSFRTVKFVQSDGYWKEFREGTQRARKRGLSVDDVGPTAQLRAQANSEAYIEYRADGIISRWSYTI
ncbi:RiboL-PSP-HEPN domain-containing protein [Vibrio crassostreae]|nr:RiboL-PSP-HEPN domain-containing protein [Vibrio crassostreae]CAK1694784.1 RiboL-PSP-HEPN domain-containing protein [Vibrio crassostreae]CAK1712954.1 RiboL-PSP-HEPN domain-containing protein [Vibrio crassostreae]CAK1713110.1 RiboL-PSP-HEPN domain-containing protein [Vibrio crassostreae]CAK1722057.1 RiboL-PSP-HEPN domain-containing protein [Vibrio crassostreae]